MAQSVWVGLASGLGEPDWAALARLFRDSRSKHCAGRRELDGTENDEMS